MHWQTCKVKVGMIKKNRGSNTYEKETNNRMQNKEKRKTDLRGLPIWLHPRTKREYFIDMRKTRLQSEYDLIRGIKKLGLKRIYTPLKKTHFRVKTDHRPIRRPILQSKTCSRARSDDIRPVIVRYYARRHRAPYKVIRWTSSTQIRSGDPTNILSNRFEAYNSYILN